MTCKAKGVYPVMKIVAGDLDSTDYMDEAAHIDKMNRRRLERMHDAYLAKKKRWRGSGCGGGREGLYGCNIYRAS